MNLATTTVRDLKVLLAPETNLPVDDQVLVYNAKTLSGECNTNFEHSIHLPLPSL